MQNSAHLDTTYQDPSKRMANTFSTISSSSFSSTHPYISSSTTAPPPSVERPAIDAYTQKLLEQQKLFKRPRTEDPADAFFNHKKKNKPSSKFDVTKYDTPYTKVIPQKNFQIVSEIQANSTQPQHIVTDPRSQEDIFALGSRSKRFSSTIPNESLNKHGYSNDEDIASTDDLASNGQPIVGTCEAIEKRYFRLIGPPHPSSVRPEGVLRKALASLVSKHRDGVNTFIFLINSRAFDRISAFSTFAMRLRLRFTNLMLVWR
jgi:hypothetical protein